MEHGPGRVRMGTRRGTLSFIELPVDTGRRGYMICVPINIGCCRAQDHDQQGLTDGASVPPRGCGEYGYSGTALSRSRGSMTPAPILVGVTVGMLIFGALSVQARQNRYSAEIE